MLFASRATTQMRPLRRTPEGRGGPGDLLCRAARPWGPTIGFASLRASHPGKPPSRPRGAYAEVPLPMAHGSPGHRRADACMPPGVAILSRCAQALLSACFPCSHLRLVAFELVVVQIEDAWIASSTTAVVSGWPHGRDRPRIVLGEEIAHDTRDAKRARRLSSSGWQVARGIVRRRILRIRLPGFQIEFS